MTPGRALRAFCLECLGATNAGGAFDCLSELCTLHPAMPFRGKPMPKSKMMPPGLDPVSDAEEAAQAARCAKAPRKRASKAMLADYCRNWCQPGDRSDCGGLLNPGTPQEHLCPLHLYHPFRPGGVAKRRLSDRQRAVLDRAREVAPQKAAEPCAKGPFYAQDRCSGLEPAKVTGSRRTHQ